MRSPAPRRFLAAGAVTIGVAAPLFLGAARWPRWWDQIAPEQTAMTWLQSVVLILTAAGCALVSAARDQHFRTWQMLAAGFVGLAIDERFALHERVRDQILAPRGVAIGWLPWVAPGDFLLVFAALAGLAVMPRVARCFRADRGAWIAMLTGVGCAATAVLIDSIDPSTWTVAQERVQQSFEECLELAADLTFGTAVGCRLLALLPSLPASSDAEGSETADTVGARDR